MLNAELLTDLRAVVGEQALLTGDRLQDRSYDESVGEVRATVLVRPRNTAEVSNVLRLCHARGQAVVPHGGLTGLVYGASATESELILSLEAMNRIESVDVAGRTLRVEAGVTLQRAQEEAEKVDLMFPLDLGGRGTATIGGNISTNAGGVRVVRYGMMRNLVLGLEAVLADGTVLCSLNRVLKNNTGYDLKQLFIGSEGTLGIVTRADLRLVSRPRSFNTAFVACRDFPTVIKLLGHVDSHLAGQLGAFEVLWPEYYEVTTTPPAMQSPPLPYGHAAYVLIESLGAEPEGDEARLEQALADALELGLIEDAVIAKSESERRSMWSIREDVWQTRRYGEAIDFDVSLSIADMPEYLVETRRALAARFPQARTYVFGHVADGNLHLAISAPSEVEEIRDAVKRCVYEPLRAIGGSISAEHGIGLERKHYLEISRSPAEIAAMRAIKGALDPKRILNPGKVFD
ncbi:MAG TPA: FAD-binding oxidoreductase [Steroidobacteraceae bacterium]|nr:FAD-binding oxidoreductase [Steroidobacteraceae bacterium]